LATETPFHAANPTVKAGNSLLRSGGESLYQGEQRFLPRTLTLVAAATASSGVSRLAAALTGPPAARRAAVSFLHAPWRLKFPYTSGYADASGKNPPLRAIPRPLPEPSMTVQCPYCHHRMRVQGAHPGRFKPACDRCNDQFLLIIPPDLDAEPMVTPLDPARRRRSREKSHTPG
jgi:hypothetical protein